MRSKSQDRVWWKNGVQFQCQGSGNCCVSHGEFGFVFLSLDDRRRLAKFFGLRTQAFTKNYCQKFNGAFHLTEIPERPECMFLKDKRCQVYSARPTQCRTWPFWPEVMQPKAWKKEVAQFCPGVGKGKIHSQAEIDKQMSLQSKTEKQIILGK